MKKTLIAISVALAAHVLMADAIQDTPANVDVSFRGEGGLVDGEETSCRTFAAGACYGSLPTPVREGHAFEGWYTDDGVKVNETDYVIPSATSLTAHWDVRLDGTEGDVRKGNDAIYSDRTGIVIPVPDDSFDYDRGNYFGAVCEVESIVSFDWVVDVTPEAVEAGEYNYWWVYVLREFSVDGKAVEAEDDHGHTHLACYNDETGVRIHVRAFLTPGSHVLKWAVPSGYAEGATVRCAVENFKVEPVAMQTDIVGWARLLADFGIWKPDNLAYLRDSVYGARVAANPDDYEARVIRAIIKIALLAEDKEVRDFMGECGWTVADYTMKISGGFCGLERLAPANDVVDLLSPVALAALDDALADLNAIPENWNGAIELSPKKYEALDESVYVDMAEITMLKAAVESARASILLVKGYDFTMDYVAVSNSLESAEYVWDVLGQAPDAGRIRDAQALLESRDWYRKSLQHVRRTDQIILWRTNPLPHFFEYDQVDANDLSRARLYLEQLIGSLDHPETIDLPYFVDKFGYGGETLPMGMFRQLYLGAVFAGRVTRDLAPDARIRPAELDMDTVEDTTLGGLFPDLGFEEFTTLFPFSQRWSLALYDVYRPQSRLAKGQTLTVADESLCDGTLKYAVNLQKLSHVTAQCVVDGLAVDTVSVEDGEGASETRSVAIPDGSQYSLVFSSGDRDMTARRQVFEIVSVPEAAPVGDGTYSQTIGGVTWDYTVCDDEATVTGVSGATDGDLSVPKKLGGRLVTEVGAGAFSIASAMNYCESAA